MSEPSPASPPPDGSLSGELAQLANAESLAYVAWCQEQIAENCYVVQLPPKPWAGRDDIIAACVQRFDKLDRLIAANAVDQAVMELWSRQKEDPANFLKQTMLIRLRGLRQLILAAIKNGRREQFFKYTPLMEIPEKNRPPSMRNSQDPTILVESKTKEKRYSGTDMGAIHMLLSIERLVADLEGLYGNTGKTSINVIQAFFDGLDNLASRPGKDEPDAASMAARAKNRSLTAPMTESQRTTLGGIMTDSEPVVTPVRANVVRRPRGRRIDSPPIRNESSGDDGDLEREDEG